MGMLMEVSRDMVGKMSRQLYGVFCLGVLIAAATWYHYYYAQEDEDDDVVYEKTHQQHKAKAMCPAHCPLI